MSFKILWRQTLPIERFLETSSFVSTSNFQVSSLQRLWLVSQEIQGFPPLPAGARSAARGWWCQVCLCRNIETIWFNLQHNDHKAAPWPATAALRSVPHYPSGTKWLESVLVTPLLVLESMWQAAPSLNLRTVDTRAPPWDTGPGLRPLVAGAQVLESLFCSQPCHISPGRRHTTGSWVREVVFFNVDSPAAPSLILYEGLRLGGE